MPTDMEWVIRDGWIEKMKALNHKGPDFDAKYRSPDFAILRDGWWPFFSYSLCVVEIIPGGNYIFHGINEKSPSSFIFNTAHLSPYFYPQRTPVNFTFPSLDVQQGHYVGVVYNSNREVPDIINNFSTSKSINFVHQHYSPYQRSNFSEMSKIEVSVREKEFEYARDNMKAISLLMYRHFQDTLNGIDPDTKKSDYV